MRRLALSIFAAGSLLLSLGAGAGWILSYARPLQWRELHRSHEANWDVVPDGPDDWGHGILHHEPKAWIEKAGHWRVAWFSSQAGQLGLHRSYLEVREDAGWLPPVRVGIIHHTPHESFGPLPSRFTTEIPTLPNRLGFRYRHEAGVAWFRGRPLPVRTEVPLVVGAQQLILPYWALVLAGLPAPLWWMWRNRRAVRYARQGRCAGCGYDLRASPERCPECGRRHDS